MTAAATPATCGEAKLVRAPRARKRPRFRGDAGPSMTGGGKGAPGEGRGGWCQASVVWEHGPVTKAFGVVIPPPGAARLIAERSRFVYGATGAGLVNGA